MADDEASLSAQVSHNIRKLREGMDWTQGELSRRLIAAGWTVFHQTTVARIEAGTRPVKLDELPAFAEVFDADLMELISNQELVRVRMQERSVEDAFRSLVSKAEGYLELLNMYGQTLDGLIAKGSIPPSQVTTAPLARIPENAIKEAKRNYFWRLNDAYTKYPLKGIGPFMSSYLEYMGLDDINVEHPEEG